ncbi:MAG: rhodanese-like domain-containing protein [Desulfococcaceae bacterium]|jgi:rhodanese-related sulfurtransferase/rubrerythrin|nr:rhodanese-like domain-containing protein [Desulfococcaceae bacterium]
MEEKGFINLDFEAFTKLREEKKEKEYLLIDVRQTSEYRAGHIPGALLMPVSELQTRLYELPADRDLIFYCHSGGRSTFASDLVSEAEVTEKNVYNLPGGIMTWEGKTLADFPRVQVFDKKRSLPELLMTAMELEKGAFRFYRYITDHHAGADFFPVMAQLSKAEEAHAKSVYQYWKETQNGAPDFESLFADLRGNILEGGEQLETVLEKLKTAESASPLHIIELALDIEYRAYDLYRTIAEQKEEAKDIFLHIAQAEKGHMKMLIKAIPSLPQNIP